MKEQNKEDKQDNSGMEKSSDIVGNIIMISPIEKVFKKLTKLSKERGMNISSLCEHIVEEYVMTNKS